MNRQGRLSGAGAGAAAIGWPVRAWGSTRVDRAAPRKEQPKVSQQHAVIEVELPSGDTVSVIRRRFCGGPGPRVAVVAGIRGDAPEGIRVAHELVTFLNAAEPRLRGTVDIYPCANPLAAHRGVPRWPFFDSDLNRLFPGDDGGHPPERVAYALTQDVLGADQVVEVRGARAAFSEVPQAHVRPGEAVAAERAMAMNVAVVWQRTPGPAAPSTFAHQFDGAIVLEGGTGNRLTPGVGKDLTDGILNMLATMGVLDEADLPFHWAALQRPVRVTDEQVARVRSNRGGLFLPAGATWKKVSAGEELGRVVDPTSGEVREVVESPSAGRLLAIRELPVVFPGTVVARVVNL
jgi:predicted deacylase